nr:MAG TPA_asm: hypothetical protein [Caudoviricetes sp.]
MWQRVLFCDNSEMQIQQIGSVCVYVLLSAELQIRTTAFKRNEVWIQQCKANTTTIKSDVWAKPLIVCLSVRDISISRLSNSRKSYQTCGGK